MKDYISDGQKRLLAGVGDRDAFTRAVCRLVESPELARKLGDAARIVPNVYLAAVCRPVSGGG
jgi:hypothetical protein